MNDAELAERLLGIFAGELEGYVRAMNEGLLALEAGRGEGESAEIWKTLFRAAHSLKGGARTVNAELLARASHRLEDVISLIRDRRLVLDAALFRTLFAAVDAIADAGKRLTSGRSFAGSPLEGVLRALDEAAGDATANPMPAPIDDTPPSVQVPPKASAKHDVAANIGRARIDALLRSGDELLIARSQLSSRIHEICAEARRIISESARKDPKVERELERLTASLARDDRRLATVAGFVEEEIRRLCMVPFSEAAGALERTVRDAAREKGVSAELVLSGGEIELDRLVLDRLRDPLAHLVRNAVTHGLESPGEREQRGKARRGVVRIAATLRASNVELAVEDDGRGIDLDAVRASAKSRGIEPPSDPHALALLIFRAGFTTRARVTELAGRGVGLDVVKTRVEELHGAVDVSSAQGAGTRFVITVPITLTRVRALLVRVANERYAFVTSNVVRLVRVRADELRSVEGRDVFPFEGAPLRVASLAAAVGRKSSELASDGRALIVVVAAGAERIGFAVDELLSEQEIVVKSLGPRNVPTKLVAGGTILADGAVALILNAAQLIRAAAESDVHLARAAKPSPRKLRVLIADDSLTTRTLEASILTAAGYEPVTAADGREALRILESSPVDAIVSDVEMPNLDGIGFAEAIRRSDRLRSLPFILVSALGNDRDRLRGLEAGADAYIVKGRFDQRELLDALRHLITRPA